MPTDAERQQILQEVQGIYDDLSNQGVFRNNPRAQRIGHELRRRRLVTDPTQGGLVQPSPTAPVSPVAAKSSTPIDPYLAPRDPAFEAAVQSYTQQYLANPTRTIGQGAKGGTATYKPIPRQLFERVLFEPTDQRFKLIPPNLSEVGKAAILRKAMMDNPSGARAMLTAPPEPNAFQKGVDTAGRVLGIPKGAVTEASRQYDQRFAPSPVPEDVEYNQRLDAMSLPERIWEQANASPAQAGRPSKLRALRQGEKTLSPLGQFGSAVANVGAETLTDPLTIGTIGVGGVAANAAGRAAERELLQRASVSQMGRIRAKLVGEAGNIAKANAGKRAVLDTARAGADVAFSAQDLLPYVANPEQIGNDPYSFAAQLPLIALGLGDAARSVGEARNQARIARGNAPASAAPPSGGSAAPQYDTKPFTPLSDPNTVQQQPGTFVAPAPAGAQGRAGFLNRRRNNEKTGPQEQPTPPAAQAQAVPPASTQPGTDIPGNAQRLLPARNVPTEGSSVPQLLTPEQQEYAQSAQPREEWLPREAIQRRDDVFQFRRKTVADFPRWNKREAAKNPITVWKDTGGELGTPGQVYNVNGAHRLVNAEKFDVPAMRVRYLDAPDARTAMEMGAVENLLDSPRNEPLDVAKFLRITQLGKGRALEFLRENGVNVQSRLMADAALLQSLPDQIFDMVYAYADRHDTLQSLATAVARYFPEEADRVEQFNDVFQRLTNKEKITVDDIRQRGEALAKKRAAEQNLGFDFDFGDINIRASVTKGIKDHFSNLTKTGRRINNQSSAKFFGVTEGQVSRKTLADQVAEIIERSAHTVSPLGKKITEATKRIMAGEEEGAVIAELVQELEKGTIIHDSLTEGKPNQPGSDARAGSDTGGSAASIAAPPAGDSLFEDDVPADNRAVASVPGDTANVKRPPVRANGGPEAVRAPAGPEPAIGVDSAAPRQPGEGNPVAANLYTEKRSKRVVGGMQKDMLIRTFKGTTEAEFNQFLDALPIGAEKRTGKKMPTFAPNPDKPGILEYSSYEWINKGDTDGQNTPAPAAPVAGTADSSGNAGVRTDGGDQSGRLDSAATPADERAEAPERKPERPKPEPGKQRLITAREEKLPDVDTSVIPESISQHLKPHQAEGVARAIVSLERDGGFILADGTGAGKTRQILGTAQYYASQGKPVLIIAPNEVLGKPFTNNIGVTGSYANDAKAMGITTKLSKGETLTPGTVYLTTYHQMGGFGSEITSDTLILFDEAHELKNLANDTKRAHTGIRLANDAGAVLFATATPADKPLHIAYLARAGALEGKGMREQFYNLGMTEITINKGRPSERKVWVVDKSLRDPKNPKLKPSDIVSNNLAQLFDRLTEKGFMLKREIAMDGVEVVMRRITLPEEGKRLMKAIEDFFTGDNYDIGDDGEKQSMLGGLQLANLLMQQRRQQETHKINAIADIVQQEHAAGRQVVVFASRVNESEVGKNVYEFQQDGEGSWMRVKFGRDVLMSSEGTMGLLKSALEDRDVTDITELHGGTKTKAPDAMEAFQSGKAGVILATIESGGTGINLDDVKGDAPRTLIIMTAPFSAVQNVQAAGRVWRLTTKSFPKIIYTFADTDIDAWNARIIGSKMQTLGAAVGGEVGRLDVENPDFITEGDLLDGNPKTPKAPKATANAEGNGPVTIKFDKKPTFETRQRIKEAGFRWDGDRSQWVGRERTPEQIALAQEFGGKKSEIQTFSQGSMGEQSLGLFGGKALSNVIEAAQEAAAKHMRIVMAEIKNNVIQNLQVTNRTGPRLSAAARRVAGSKSEATAILKGAMPRVYKALGNDPGKVQDFLEALTESRLRGAEERWRSMSGQAQMMPNATLLSEYGRADGFRDMLEKIDSLLKARTHILNTADMWAAHAVATGDHTRLRGYLTAVFRDAGDQVSAHYKQQGAWYNSLMDPATGTFKDAGMQEALATYKASVERPMRENHELNDGILSQNLGPLDTYIPLFPHAAQGGLLSVQGKSINRVFSPRAPLAKPENTANRMATGLHDNYAVSMQEFSDRLGRAIRANNQADFVDTLLTMRSPINKDPIAIKLPQGAPIPETITIDGDDVPATALPASRQKVVIANGKAVGGGEARILVPTALAKEIKDLMTPGDNPDTKLGALSGFMTNLALLGPFDAAFHSANILSALTFKVPIIGVELVRGTGKVAQGANLAATIAGNTPFTKVFTGVMKAIYAARTSDTESAQREINELARLGVLHKKFGAETYSKDYAMLTGAKRSLLGAGPALYGPKGLDVGARLVIYRATKAMMGIDGPIYGADGKLAIPAEAAQQLYDMVQTVGQYHRELKGNIVKFLSETGISPFAVAADTFMRNGTSFWMGGGKLPTLRRMANGQFGQMSVQRQAAYRTAQMLSGGVVGVIAMWALAHKELHEKWPWQDKDAKFLQTYLPDHLANTPLARKLYGDKPGKKMVSFAFLNPNAGRGVIGKPVADMFNASQADADTRQIGEAGTVAALNQMTYGAGTSPVIQMATAALGFEPYLIGVEPTGRPELLPAVEAQRTGMDQVKANGLEVLLNSNALLQDIAAMRGIGYEGRPQKGDAEHSRVTEMVLSLAFPRLIAGTNNQNMRRKMYKRDRYETIRAGKMTAAKRRKAIAGREASNQRWQQTQQKLQTRSGSR